MSNEPTKNETSQEETTATQTTPAVKEKGWSWWNTALAIAAVIVFSVGIAGPAKEAFVFGKQWLHFGQEGKQEAIVASSEAQPKIVVLNVQGIITASTNQITENKSLSVEQVGEVSKMLADNLKKIVTSYHDQGYIVVNSSFLITWPDAVDITKTTADQLGVKL